MSKYTTIVSKGYKKMRFRKLSKQINNRVLYSILLSKEITISQFTEKLGISKITINNCVFEGMIPAGEDKQKITVFLNYPIDIIFNQNMINCNPIICIPEASHYYKRVISNSPKVNRILHGLFILHDLSISDVARWTGIHPHTLRDYINNKIIPPYDYQVELSNFFRIPVGILFYDYYLVY